MNLTQKDLAVRVNTSQSSISKYENGSDSPSFDMAVKIADALNCSLDDLAERSFPYVTENKKIHTNGILP